MVSPLVWRVDSTFRLPVWETVKPILSVISSGGAAVGAAGSSLAGSAGGGAGGSVGVAAGVQAARANMANSMPIRTEVRMVFIRTFLLAWGIPGYGARSLLDGISSQPSSPHRKGQVAPPSSVTYE